MGRMYGRIRANNGANGRIRAHGGWANTGEYGRIYSPYYSPVRMEGAWGEGAPGRIGAPGRRGEYGRMNAPYYSPVRMGGAWGMVCIMAPVAWYASCGMGANTGA